MARSISRRHSVFLAFGAALAAVAFPWRRREAEPTFVQKTAPGDRYRKLSVGARSFYVRDDLVTSGWYRDFQFHDKGEAR